MRWNTSKAFLKPVRGRPNLTVMTEAQAEGVIFQGDRAAGVLFQHRGKPAAAAARGEVILSAGAIGSPQLLQVSGIGPGDLLQACGIDVVQALPGVGENLQDHLQLRMIYKVKNTSTLNQEAASLMGRIGMGVRYALFRRGPLAMAPSHFGAFTRSDPSRSTPNLEYHIQPLSLDKFGEPLHPFPAFTASVANLRPESRGTVRIKTPDPAVYPAIRPNYLFHPADQQVAVDAIKLTRRICGGSRTGSIPSGGVSTRAGGADRR